MAQAKGILPRQDDRDVLYKNPRTCGYFVAVKLDPTMDRPRTERWLTEVSQLIDELVARLSPVGSEKKGEKVAAVAVGLAPSFFTVNGAPRFNPAVEPPASFTGDMSSLREGGLLKGVQPLDADVLFYIASVFEARVNTFISKLAGMKPDVQAIRLERGYQRLDETEPFGYKDGVRNIRLAQSRPQFVFVHRDDRELEEPAWADGGSYMAYIKILQRPEQFAMLSDDTTRDQVIGRTKDGTRLDLLGRDIDPKHESAEPPQLPPTSHVLKAAPRGQHDDTQIFRRGLPFIETDSAGQVRVGLNFCSFQASLDQFDVVFNDWISNRHFPQQPNGGEVGVDALLDPARQFTAFEKVGFFVPPYHEEGLAAAVFATDTPRKRTSGRLVIHKRVFDQSDPTRRFERGGFKFRILDSQGQPVSDSEFATDSTGRGLCPVELEIDRQYTLQEVSSPVANVQPVTVQFTMDKPNQQLRVDNQVTQPNTPYGG